LTDDRKTRLDDILERIPLQDVIAREAGVRFRRVGDRYVGRCPFHADKTPSFTVFTNGVPRYKCFGAQCGVHGTVLTFLQKWKQLSYGDAIRMAADLVDMPTPEITDFASGGNRETAPLQPWSHAAIAADVKIPEPFDPILLHNPSTKVTYWSEPSHVHVYRDRNGRPLLLVVRFDQTDGRKYFQQVIWRPGPIDKYPAIPGCWQQLEFDPKMARPLYGGEDIPAWQARAGSRLLFVEGEKTRDAAAAVLDLGDTGILTLSNVGSTGGIGKTDLEPVLAAFRRSSDTDDVLCVDIWPDADIPPGTGLDTVGDAVPKFVTTWLAAFGSALESMAIDSDRMRIRWITPPVGRKHGWDLADAVDEGWSAAMIRQWMADNAQELTPV